ncbi:hypothetical protein [Azorhizophilus paspali]|uniref:Uncharacterized protein n=1 Tax=Azorhizophilus paspali TaxID=69963 RepID=A0ABV6SHF0_AZOPA
MADIELLKRLTAACDIERCADEEERDRNLNDFYGEISLPSVIEAARRYAEIRASAGLELAGQGREG